MKRRLLALAAAALLASLATPSFADSAGAAAAGNRPPLTDDEKAWQEAMHALKAKGYSEGVIMPSVLTPGAWIGSARNKDGKRVDIAVDAEGNVIPQ